jgi:MscS family membrane protein
MKTLIRLLSAGLLLGLALGPAWGQVHRQETASVHEPEPSGPPLPVPSDIPVDDFDRGTPRRTVEGFRRAVRAHNYQRAAEYLDLQRLSAEEARILGPQLARHLKIVMDQQMPIDVERLSDSPSGYLEDGLPPDLEELGRIETPERPVHIRLQRVPREDGVRIWKLSAASVEAIPELYRRYGYGLFGEAVPRVLNETDFLGTTLRQWVALPILVGVGYGLGVLITSLGVRLLRRRRSELASVLHRFVAGPVQLLVMVLFLSVGHRFLQPSVIMDRILTAAEQIALIIAIAWIILSVVESVEESIRSQALRRGRTVLLPLLPVVRKTTKIFIATFAGLAVLHSFGVNVITVLAGLGIGGIAVALAAQKTLENFIGSITLYVDQPVRVGEVCRFGGTIGTVEEVGLRSTRVRTRDRTMVTIPNATFSSLEIENLARRDRFWYHPTLSLRYETSPDQLRYILVEVRRLLYAHPKVESTSARVRFVGFGSSSLDLEVSSYVNVTDGTEYLEVAEDLNLRLMDIIAAAGSSFAFPSQTTYIEQGIGLDAARAQAAEAQVQTWREQDELYVQRFPPEKIAEISNTLRYPADGSAAGPGPRR